MIQLIKLLLFAVIITGCARQKPQQQITHLEGYWEIQRVEINPDSVREYKVNPTIDLIEFEGTTGTRKKVRPKVDGTYEVTGNSEDIEAIYEGDKLYLVYKTPFDTWRERVIHAEETDLKLQNDDGIIYYYKRFTPLNISSNEEK